MTMKKTKSDWVPANLVYYLCCPPTPDNDSKKSEEIQSKLIRKYTISVINALVSTSIESGWDLLVERRKSMLKVCGAIILCPNWTSSALCKKEALWAIELGIDIYSYGAYDSSLIPMSAGQLSQILNSKEIYSDSNISIKHDESTIDITYFGEVYSLQKEKLIISNGGNCGAINSQKNI